MDIVSKDDLGDRMKGYEAVETMRRFEPGLPLYARIDGRSFSKFTRDMRRPFDPRMTTAMIATTCYLVAHTHARIGYVQSDEISLIWQAAEPTSSLFFDGKIAKMTSVLASLATAALTQAISKSDDFAFRTYADRMPHFDARVISLPSREEATNMMLWRSLDATRNAVQSAAYSQFSHRSLHGMSQASMREKLQRSLGIDFDRDYPASFRLGTFVRRQTVERTLTMEEYLRLPEAHRPSFGTHVQRSEVVPIPMPRLLSVKNRTEVIFEAAEPILETKVTEFADQGSVDAGTE